MTAAETQILLNELQLKVDQLPTKGTLKALEYRLDAILQANLDTFWLLICAILVFLMQAGFMCLETGLSRNKNSINVALKNVTDFGIAVVVFWAFGFALMYGTSVAGLFGNKFYFFTTKVAGYQTYFVFQAMFVATAATIISGAVAERLKSFSYVIITFFASGFFDSIVDLIYGFSDVTFSGATSFDVALTSVILNDDSVVLLILGKFVFCLSDDFILLVICLCLGVIYCSTNASTYFLSCIEIILLF